MHRMAADAWFRFLDTCNEFWWLALYVAKALCRRELTLGMNIRHQKCNIKIPVLVRLGVRHHP